MRLPFLAVRTRSADETVSLGRRVGGLLRPGEVLLLTGELGTGKTTFVRGLAVGLGIDEQPTSPTFTMMHVHEGGRYPLLHVDLFRCDSPRAVIELGLEELLDPPSVAAIEWGDKATPIVPVDFLELEFVWDAADEDVRTIHFRPSGRWNERMRELGDEVRSWASGGAA
jgi:tRNA threonylcarbamoyladenosine biosynthesis protein TsaE